MSRFRGRLMRHWVPALIVVFLAGCGRIRTEERIEATDDGSGFEETYSTETTLFADADRVRLEKARKMQRQGQHQDAIVILESMEADSNVSTELRQEVLLNLGEVHGAWNNAFRDYQKGLEYLHKLLEEFPETEHKVRAEELITQYSAALER